MGRTRCSHMGVTALTASKQQVGHSATGKTINKNQAAAAIGNKRKKISALSFDKIEILE